MEEEKSPKPGGEPKCIKGAAAGAGGQGRGGRAGGRRERREVWGAEERGAAGGRALRRGPHPCAPPRAHARTHSLAALHCWRTRSLAAISGVRRMKSPQPWGHGALGLRLCAGRQAGRGLPRAPPAPELSAPAAPPDLGGGAGQPEEEAKRPVCGALGWPLPPLRPCSRRPALCGYCSAPRLRGLALLVLRAWHWRRQSSKLVAATNSPR